MVRREVLSKSQFGPSNCASRERKNAAQQYHTDTPCSSKNTSRFLGFCELAELFELHYRAAVRRAPRRRFPGVAVHHFVADGKLAVALLRGEFVRKRGAKPAPRKTASRRAAGRGQRAGLAARAQIGEQRLAVRVHHG